MSESLSKEQELESDLVAFQLVIKQILDVIDVIAPTEVRDKMSHQLKSIDFSTHPAGADPVTRRAIEKAISLIELKFTKHDS
jgi:electron transfer flavoprotein alpha/beta subunit